MPIKTRAGKRGGSSSSSSSFGSTKTTVFFVALCVGGIWFFTSSSSSSALPMHSSTSHVRVFPDRLSTRLKITEPPPALEDTQGYLPEDAVKNDDSPHQEKEDGEGNNSQDVRMVTSNERSYEEEQKETSNEQSSEEEQKLNNIENSSKEEQKEGSNEQSAEEEQKETSNEQLEQKETNFEQKETNFEKFSGEERKETSNEHEQKETNFEQFSGEEHKETSNEQEQKESNFEQSSGEEHKEMGSERSSEEEKKATSGDQSTEEERQQKEEQNIDHDLEEHRDEDNGEKEKEQRRTDKIAEEERERRERSEEQKQEVVDSNDEQNAVTTVAEETAGGLQSNETQDAFHPQIDVSVQKQIEDEEPTTLSNSAGGITSHSQIEHDTEGTPEEHQQEAEHRNDDNPNGSDSLPEGSQAEMSSEKGKTWATQADQSVDENARRKEDSSSSNEEGSGGILLDVGEWQLCNVKPGPDYIPCLDNEKAIKKLHGIKHFEHRERHCPEESPTCLVPLPEGYKQPIEWPQSRDRIWYSNVPHAKLAEVKGHQNWVKVTGEYLTFPGGGTQFIHGALHYIDFIQKSARPVSWGKHTRVILDVGCGVASFGGYLFERDVLTMSFAPKDEHEAQVQFALERGIPAISAVMGSQRLPFPSRVFDLVHCARCRVPWHANGGALLLELNRVLRPGGFFVWSATPVYQKLQEDVEIWEAMKALTKSMCWDLYTIQKDRLNGVGNAFYRKPISNHCYQNRVEQTPPMCQEDDNPNAAWYVPLQSCLHPVPTIRSERGGKWPEEWPQRLEKPPYWLNSSQIGIYGKPEPNDFTTDYEHWRTVVDKSYFTGFGIDWSKVRNVMDMRAVYGGFAAALKDVKVWVMNLVNIDAPDTLPIIFERGLFGMYHDWCESFSTYPRTYDLLHADHLFSQLKKRCKILPTVVEVDRIVRPGGKFIVRDESAVVSEVESLLKSLHWEVRLTYSKNQEGILYAEKSEWRPDSQPEKSSI